MKKINIAYNKNGYPKYFEIDEDRYDLFDKDNPIKLSSAIDNLELLIDIINENEIIIDDYKRILDFIKDQIFINKTVTNYKFVYDGGDKYYNLLKGRVSFIYHRLEYNKVYVENEWKNVHYGFTITDRGKTFNYNIQNSQKDLYFSNQFDMFLVLDWHHADIWSMAKLSSDDVLMNYIMEEDLYNKIAKDFNINRQDAKRLFLSSVYKLQYDSDILKPFGRLCEYMRECISKLNNNESINTILGKPIFLNERGIRSAFNRVIQNSTAHLLHATLYNFFVNKINIITDLYDSIVISIFEHDLNEEFIKKIIKLFIRPLDDFPTLRCKIYKGRKWKKWN